MPHVIVKLFAGRSEQDKTRLAEEVTNAVKSVLKSEDKSVSVSIEDIQPADWTDQVYKPDILDKPELVYKKPGYNPLSSTNAWLQTKTAAPSGRPSIS
jgi:4-oxalocrotonate tautomerase